MTAATFTPSLWWTKKRAVTTTAPAPKRRAPVLIHDAVLPFRGETLLLALLREQESDV